MSDPLPLAPRVPVTVICGFLGAGKTTLLKRILEKPEGRRFAVLVNDFGSINIDAALVVETGADQVALSNGCVCCSIRDDLVEALERTVSLAPPPDRIIIEASGVSRPLSILEALDRPEVAGRLSADATVCLVDTDHFPGLDYASTELAIDQAVSSDLLILNKCDIASTAYIHATEATLTGPMPNVRRIRTAFAEVPNEILFGIEVGDKAARRLPTHGHDGAHDHGHNHGHDGAHDHDHCDDHDHVHTDEFEAWSWSCDGPLDAVAVRAAVRELPASLLRAKGILRVRTGDGERRVVFHLVGKRSVLAEEPGAPPAESQLVAIARRGGLDRTALGSLLDRCRAG